MSATVPRACAVSVPAITPTQAWWIPRALSFHCYITYSLHIQSKSQRAFCLFSFQLVFHCHECSIQNEFCDRNVYFVSIHLLLKCSQMRLGKPLWHINVGHWSAFEYLTHSKLASGVRQALHLPALNPTGRALKQLLRLSWVQWVWEWTGQSWGAERKLTYVPSAREGERPTSGETVEGSALRGMNQGSRAAWTLAHPFAEGRCYHQPSSHPPPVGSLAPIFSIRCLLHFCFLLDLECRADTLKALAHLLPSSSLRAFPH